jgi:hypothetical protein
METVRSTQAIKQVQDMLKDVLRPMLRQLMGMAGGVLRTSTRETLMILPLPLLPVYSEPALDRR